VAWSVWVQSGSGMATVSLLETEVDLVALSLNKHIQGYGGLMIRNHAVAGMWEMEGLSNAAASSYRWFRDVIGHKKLNSEKLMTAVLMNT